MKSFLSTTFLCVIGVLAFVAPSVAHFAMVIPSTDVVGKENKKEIGLLIQFTHPFEGEAQMDMNKPLKLVLVQGDKVINLLDTLKKTKVNGKSAWGSSFKITKPDDYNFFMSKNHIGNLLKTITSSVSLR